MIHEMLQLTLDKKGGGSEMENQEGGIAQEDCHEETLKEKLINEMKEGETCKDLFT